MKKLTTLTGKPFNTNFTIYLPVELLIQVQELSEQQRISRTQFTLNAIKAAVDLLAKPKPKPKPLLPFVDLLPFADADHDEHLRPYDPVINPRPVD